MATHNLTAETLAPLCPLAGELIINWSLMDSIIVKMVAAIYHAAGGKHEHPTMPFEFSRRVKFLRRCVKKIPALAPFASEMNEITRIAKVLLPIRDFIIHGAISAYDPDRQVYTFEKLDIDYSDNMHEANRLHVRLTDLDDAIAGIQKITPMAAALADRLVETFLR